MFALSGQRTAAGIARIAQERRQALLPPPVPVAPQIAPVVTPEPETAKIIPFVRTPRDETNRIIDLVARMHGATFSEVMGKSRAKRIVLGRHAAVCAVKQAYPCQSLPHIARKFGYTDHAIICHALRKRGFR